MLHANHPLAPVFSPRSVAVIGASETVDKYHTYGRRAVECLKQAGFPNIYPVNPRRAQVLGLPCYPSVGAIPGPVDYVIMAIPAAAALDVLDECAAKGVKCVHVYAAGFSESLDLHGPDLEKVVLAKAKAGGFRVVGPNCMGVFVPGIRLTTWNDVPLEPGPVSLLSQSGGFGEEIPYRGDNRGLRFSKAISLGNGLDVDSPELLEYFAQDPDTEIIGAYIEGVKDGNRLRTALEQAAARKPVVVHKGGATGAGKRAARGHTASLAGSTDTFRVLCRQVNAIQVPNLEEMVDMLVALRFVRPLPRGTGVGVVGRGGGISVLASDEIEGAGLSIPPLADGTLAELKGFLPLPGSIFANPVDSSLLQSPDAILSVMKVLGQVSGISLLVYHIGFHPTSRWRSGKLSSQEFRDGLAGALSEVPRLTGKPVLVALNPPPDLEGMGDFLGVQESLVRAGLPVFHSLRRAALAALRLVEWNSRRGA